jgi:Ca2+-binding RTX toxin-like protein
VPPDEVITSLGADQMGVFGLGPTFPLLWATPSSRTVPAQTMTQASVESATLGDLDNDSDLDVLVGQPVNSLSSRVASLHAFEWGDGGLDQVATALPSTPGVDGVAIADVDGDTCNDVIAAGTYGTGMVHLGTGAGAFDGGQDLPQLGYQNPGTATRVTLAVDDLTGDGRPEIVISDALQSAVMVYRNASTTAGAACKPPAPAPTETPTVVPPPAPPPPPSPTPPPSGPRTCDDPGVAPFTVGTPGDDVLVGTPGRDMLSGRGGDDCLFGRAGDDRLRGGSGADILSGASGDDGLTGDAGDDKLNGGNGNDKVTPGAGQDKVAAGGGNDEIAARDGTRDTVDCGAGRDKAAVDRRDVVKANCERVRRRG